MFFIFGISNGRKQLDYHQSTVCNVCGRYGSYQVFMEYMFFSLFFIPVFKWNKTYFVKTSCCETLYTIDSELGRRIAKGENLTLGEEDLHVVQRGRYFGIKRCRQCGYTTDEDFQYCPKCAQPLI
ncbi:MAG: zinc ribbon domain-containing protein [Caldicoprobacterales bacterium]|nr:zinc ribbon domain-containing protein [Clostridiales bacterium]